MGQIRNNEKFLILVSHEKKMITFCTDSGLIKYGPNKKKIRAFQN